MKTHTDIIHFTGKSGADLMATKKGDQCLLHSNKKGSVYMEHKAISFETFRKIANYKLNGGK